MRDPVADMMAKIDRFAQEIIGVDIPDKPTMLSHERASFRFKFLKEEMEETELAYVEGNMEQVVDGLIDLTYVALGTLIEMGVAPGPVFDEVHRANMEKRRGTKSTRPGSAGYDAIKPDDWRGPELMPYLEVTKQTLDFLTQPLFMSGGMVHSDGFLSLHGSAPDIDVAVELPNVELSMVVAEEFSPNILVLGYGRHGKDTVCDMLRDDYGLTFTSSSMFCAEKVVLPYFNENPALPSYSTAKECYDDRHGSTGDVQHRAVWYDAIRKFNTPDASALGRAIWEDNNVYCGLRSSAEFHALKNSGVPDLVLWVDASERVQEKEDRSSCTVEPWMADFVIDNNGDLAQLRRNLDELVKYVMPDLRVLEETTDEGN